MLTVVVEPGEQAQLHGLRKANLSDARSEFVLWLRVEPVPGPRWFAGFVQPGRSIWSASADCVGIRGDVGSVRFEAVVRCGGREKTAWIQHDLDPARGELLEVRFTRRSGGTDFYFDCHPQAHPPLVDEGEEAPETAEEPGRQDQVEITHPLMVDGILVPVASLAPESPTGSRMTVRA